MEKNENQPFMHSNRVSGPDSSQIEIIQEFSKLNESSNFSIILNFIMKIRKL